MLVYKNGLWLDNLKQLDKSMNALTLEAVYQLNTTFSVYVTLAGSRYPARLQASVILNAHRTSSSGYRPGCSLRTRVAKDGYFIRVKGKVLYMLRFMHI